MNICTPVAHTHFLSSSFRSARGYTHELTKDFYQKSSKEDDLQWRCQPIWCELEGVGPRTNLQLGRVAPRRAASSSCIIWNSHLSFFLRLHFLLNKYYPYNTICHLHVYIGPIKLVTASQSNLESKPCHMSISGSTEIKWAGFACKRLSKYQSMVVVRCPWCLPSAIAVERTQNCNV
jgi:hypothetical protein